MCALEKLNHLKLNRPFTRLLLQTRFLYLMITEFSEIDSSILSKTEYTNYQKFRTLKFGH